MEKFDAIIVGAGLAGLSAGYMLAKEGMEVLILERGDYPGAKNMTGGRIYLNPILEYFPELWQKAPFERGIAKEELSLMSGTDSLNLSFMPMDGVRESAPQYSSYSVLRAKFDKWFAKQVENAGAVIVPKSKVDGLIKDGEQVIGVTVAGDELHADVVIAADGVLSLLSEQAGLRKPGKPVNYAVGIKEIIEMDRGVLEDRFGLEADEGLARMFMGDVTNGLFGGGFLYTNKDSISLGVVVGIHSFAEGDCKTGAPDMLERFKSRPEISRLIKGGASVEYSAHVVPEGGKRSFESFYGGGILAVGDAAGFCMNLGLTVRGMDYAVMSGCLAAQAVSYARGKGSFDAATLGRYGELLKESLLMKDFETFKKAPEILDNPRLFTRYPELAGKIFGDLYKVPNAPKERLMKSVRKHLPFSEIIKLGKDALKLVKL